jgi:hypothetical protein
MRKLFILVFILFPLSLFAFQNEPDNFRGIKWGTTIDKLPEMYILGDFTF